MTCALCTADTATTDHRVGPEPRSETVALCETCIAQLTGPAEADHWRALATTMWAENAPTQVLAWRMLDRLAPTEAWAQDLLDQLWLDEDTLAWAQSGKIVDKPVHRDSNGAILENGDTVTLIKALPVKGANFTAKRGTAVQKISLVPDNPLHIEGRVEGQRIVILTEFVKKR